MTSPVDDKVRPVFANPFEHELPVLPVVDLGGAEMKVRDLDNAKIGHAGKAASAASNILQLQRPPARVNSIGTALA